VSETTEVSKSFPEKWKASFEGLLYLGYLEKQVEIPFHKFLVRTLTAGEKINISLITAELSDTLGYGRAYRSAVVAAGLVLVDDQKLIAAEKDVDLLRQKYDYVITSWHDPIIDILFEAINELEGQVVEVLQELDIINIPTTQPIFEENEEGGDDPKDGSQTPTFFTT
jgi:hypothetical protein